MKRNKITVKFFGQLKKIMQKEEIFLELDFGETIGDLKSRLIEMNYRLATYFKNCLVMVDKTHILLDEDEVPENAEVTFLPPIAGGERRE